MNEKEIVIRCEGLTRDYQGARALDGLNLQINAGEIFAYVGPYGAGKTTTVRILAGLLKATSGEASICGLDVTGQSHQLKSMIAYMPESFGVYDHMRVWEYLDFFGAACNIPRKKRGERIDYVLTLTGSEPIRESFVETLCHDAKQQIGIARTLLHDPKVLLLDEPLRGLAPAGRVQMRKLLRRLADEGKTLLVSSHVLPELVTICDSVGIIEKGKLQVAGPAKEVLAGIRQDRLIELKVLSGLQEAAAAIERSDSAGEPDRSDAGANLLRFSFTGDDQTLSALLDELIKGGAKVITMREVPVDLQEACTTAGGVTSQQGGPGPRRRS